jgi:hypothetical protein
MVWVFDERTVNKEPAEKWLSACPQTYRTGDHENKDGEINNQETQKRRSHRLH